MFKCKECGCNCDNADIINGICDDCREEIERQEKKTQDAWFGRRPDRVWVLRQS